MGYRSNIRCLIYALDLPAGEEAKLVVNYHALKTVMNTTFKDVLAMWDAHIVFDDAHKVVDFNIDDVKWYESYPDVDAFDKMLPAIEELGYCYEFVRVGEDSNDVEYRQSDDHHNYLGTSTVITCYF